MTISVSDEVCNDVIVTRGAREEHNIQCNLIIEGTSQLINQALLESIHLHHMRIYVSVFLHLHGTELFLALKSHHLHL